MCARLASNETSTQERDLSFDSLCDIQVLCVQPHNENVCMFKAF